MAFRTVIIKNRCKLSYSLNYMICRKENEESKILVDEIKNLIIDSYQVSITSALISELLRKKVKVIFVDDKHNPNGEIVPYQNNFYSYRHIKEQINIDNSLKIYLWMEIIKEKIKNQKNNLLYIGNNTEASKLDEYYKEVVEDDATNREGHSAKVYFNALFGKDFNRDKECNTNAFLNYGYSILLSSISREIKTYGFLTELGIHHIGESNSFNLSCDFIEPIRPLVDYYVISKKVNFDNFKLEFIKMLNSNVNYQNKNIVLDNAIHLYVGNLLNFLKTGDVNKIRFIEYATD